MLHALLNRIMYVPDALFQHARLRELDLSTNELSSLPLDIHMKRMAYFYLANNSLTSIPSSICNHEYLANFAVDGNHIRSLPANIGNLENSISYLCFARNNLTTFPSSFSRLKNLEILDVRNNSLTSLPSWMNLKGCRI